MIAARQIFLGRGGAKVPTAADYVQDGLVAMWDGEWNAGGGVHDANATVWKDLSGNGYDGMLVAGQLGTGYSWESDAFVRYAANSNGGWTQIDMTGAMLSAARNATFTVEIVTGRPTAANGWQAQIFNLCQSGQGYNKGLCAMFRKETDGETAGVYSVSYPTSGSSYVSPYDANASVSLVVGGDNTSWSMNNVQKGFRSISPDSSILTVLARLGSSGYAFCGRYMNYRIYSRTLTTAEREANYAVDKARFNLP